MNHSTFGYLFKLSSRFRWVFCQLEVLRHCLPPSVRHTLDELPESLDETYERILKEIKKPNRGHARRVLQCLVVAIRPLRVEELAEVLAVDFRDDGIPKLNPNWRWEDQEQALLTSCSSLIVVVESGASRIVQFSHFSVKEFLTSDRLATSNGDISRHHIDLQPAHTVLAQACLGVLLPSNDRAEENGVRNNSPLARYAAEHWVTHARDKKVSSHLRMAMEYLFDVDKPHFLTWLQLYDIDTPTLNESSFHRFTPFSKSGATPLYYAARCGFQDLVEHLIVNNPEQLNATGGYFVSPLVAALGAGHASTAKFLRDNGAHPNVKGYRGMTPLHSTALCGDFEMVQVLLKYKADVNARNAEGRTPLHSASQGLSLGDTKITQSLSDVARLMLEHGADINARDIDRSSPLHVAARYGRIDVVRVLLEHSANLGSGDDDGPTTFHDYINARDTEDRTPLHLVSEYPVWNNPDFDLSLSNVARLLLERGADVNAVRNDLSTSLHVAARYGRVEVVRVLLEHGANLGAEDDDAKTAFEVASERGYDEIKKLLTER